MNAITQERGLSFLFSGRQSLFTIRTVVSSGRDAVFAGSSAVCASLYRKTKGFLFSFVTDLLLNGEERGFTMLIDIPLLTGKQQRPFVQCAEAVCCWCDQEMCMAVQHPPSSYGHLPHLSLARGPGPADFL